MRLAVMQPYFFPYLGYFQLIHSVEHFMFFDGVQYVKQSWMSRNRLLNFQNDEPYYFRPELIHPEYQAMLPEVQLKQDGKWKQELMKSLCSYKNKAPFYQETQELIRGIIDQDYRYLVDLNIGSTIEIAHWLGLDVKFDRYSGYRFEFDGKLKVGMWGLEISRAVDTNIFINAPGGEAHILPEGFEASGIKLGFIQPVMFPYHQNSQQFHSHLSIVDVLMFNGKENVMEHLNDYSIKWMN
jgi:hypothetical protein